MLQLLPLFTWLFTLAMASNSHSQVIELNDKFLDVMHEGLWFVEFYAPWCGHCKQLAPIWEQVAHSLAVKKSKVRVVKIDCTRFSNIASKLDIQGYPTVKFFRNGRQITYEGERTKDMLIDFALKTSGWVCGKNPEVRHLDGMHAFLQIQEEHGKKGRSFFLLVNNKTGQDTDLSIEYYKTAGKMISMAYFFEIAKHNLPTTFGTDDLPCVFVFKDGRHARFDEQQDSNLTRWLRSEKWPVFPLINRGNLQDIGTCCDNLLVLAVLSSIERNTPDSTVENFSSLVKNVAINHHGRFACEFQFGWLDGNEIVNNIVLSTHARIPGILVFNVSSYEYYLCDDQPEQMTSASLVSWLELICAGEQQSFGGRSLVQRMKRIAFELVTTVYTMFATQPLLSCCLFGLPLSFLTIICYSICSSDFNVEHDDVYPDSDDEDTDTDSHEKID